MDALGLAVSADTGYVTVSFSCNNRCPFCSQAALRERGGRLSFAETLRLLDEAADADCRVVEIVGGEVTTLPEFEDLVTHAGARFESVAALTNGRRLHDAAYCRRLVAAGLRSVGVSLHAPTAAVHDALSGVDGAFDQSVRGLENLIGLQAEWSDLEVWVTTTLQPENLALLVPLGERLLALGVRRWTLRYPGGRPYLVPYREALPRIHDAIAVHGEALEVRTENVPLCVLRPFAHHSADLLADEALSASGRAIAPTEALAGGREYPRPCRRCAARGPCRGPEASYRRRYGGRGLTPLEPTDLDAVVAAAQALTARRRARSEGRGDAKKAIFERLGALARAGDWRAVHSACEGARVLLDDDDPEVSSLRDRAAEKLREGPSDSR